MHAERERERAPRHTERKTPHRVQRGVRKQNVSLWMDGKLKCFCWPGMGPLCSFQIGQLDEAKCSD